MKHTIYISAVISIMALGCTKNDYSNKYIEKTYVEFPFESIVTTISYNDLPPYNLYVPIQLFGNKLLTQDSIQISSKNEWFTVNEDYTIESTKQISKNTLKDSIQLLIQSNKFNINTLYSIPLKIESSGSNIEISENNNLCTVYFIKESFSQFFSGTYSCYETSTNATYEVTFRSLSAQSNIIMNQNFWDFPEKGEEVEYVFSFGDDHTIEIPETEFTDKLGNTYIVYGSGYYTLDGNFSVDFFMEHTNGELYQSGTHVFTKL